MTIISGFCNVFKADLIKYRKSIVPWITLLYPFFTVALITIINIGMNELPDRPLFDFSRNLLLVSSFFLPFYLSLLITQVNFTENRIQGWKLLYAQPVPRALILFSKVGIIFLCCVTAYLLTALFAVVSSEILGLHEGTALITALKADFVTPMVKLMLVYLSASLMMAMQFWLSLRFRNFIVPLGIGIAASILPIAIFIALGIAGLIQGQGGLTRILRIDPYTLPYSFSFNFGALADPDFLGEIPPVYLITSISLALIIYILSFIDHTRRNSV